LFPSPVTKHHPIIRIADIEEICQSPVPTPLALPLRKLRVAFHILVQFMEVYVG
jgi:hypothetical protein